MSEQVVYDRLAVVGKAFASARRLELLELLVQGERSVDALARELEVGVSTASAHLQILKLSQLVSTRREGTRVFYRLAGDDVLALFVALRRVAEAHSADVGAALASHFGIGDAPDVPDVQVMARTDLAQRLHDADVTVLDVRPPAEYAAGHLPGAQSVPLGELLAWAGRTDLTGRTVVAYCRGAWCVLAHDAVRLLGSAQVPARRLEGGWAEWRAAGGAVEGAA